MRKSKNRKRVQDKKRARVPKAKEPRRFPPRPWYLGDDAMHGRLPGSFESNSR